MRADRLRQLFLLGGLLRWLERSISAGGKLVLELLDTPCGVDELQFAGVERVAGVANVNLELFASASGGEAVTATAGYRDLLIVRVNSVFHGSVATFEYVVRL